MITKENREKPRKKKGFVEDISSKASMMITSREQNSPLGYNLYDIILHNKLENKFC